MKNKGITMIALVVTIVVLLILAGITIGTLTGENGLIGNSNEAKEQTEIANEKEILEQAIIKAMRDEKYGSIDKNKLEVEISNMIGEGKIEVNDLEDKLEITFIESGRYYEIDSNGNIGDYQVVVHDKYPGDITKSENGETLDGSEEHPYEINCIEDLVVFSNMVNGSGVKLENGQAVAITSVVDFTNKYVILKRSLNFQSKNSYINSQRTDFGDINGDDTDGNKLITEVTTGTGFVPIGNNDDSSRIGDFNGNNHKLEGLYENRENNRAGLFGRVKGTIRNLEVNGNVYIASGVASGIVGKLDNGTIYHCKNYCEISGSTVGGIIGDAASTVEIEECYNYGNITSTGSAGGIVGYEYASTVKIKNSCNLGKIEAQTYAGGILGLTTAGTLKIYNCYNIGEVTAKYNSNNGFYWGAGGILSFKYHTTVLEIVNCINMGKVSNDSHRGAIIGFNWMPNSNPEVINCFYQKDNEIKGESNNNNTQAVEFDGNREEVVEKLNYYILEKIEEFDTSKWKMWQLDKNNNIAFNAM